MTQIRNAVSGRGLVQELPLGLPISYRPPMVVSREIEVVLPKGQTRGILAMGPAKTRQITRRAAERERQENGRGLRTSNL